MLKLRLVLWHCLKGFEPLANQLPGSRACRATVRPRSTTRRALRLSTRPGAYRAGLLDIARPCAREHLVLPDPLQSRHAPSLSEKNPFLTTTLPSPEQCIQVTSPRPHFEQGASMLPVSLHRLTDALSALQFALSLAAGCAISEFAHSVLLSATDGNS